MSAIFSSILFVWSNTFEKVHSPLLLRIYLSCATLAKVSKHFKNICPRSRDAANDSPTMEKPQLVPSLRWRMTVFGYWSCLGSFCQNIQLGIKLDAPKLVSGPWQSKYLLFDHQVTRPTFSKIKQWNWATAASQLLSQLRIFYDTMLNARWDTCL